jgi:hypothetical protein
MNDPHDWLEAYQSLGEFVREGKLSKSPGQLFALDHFHNDGTLGLLGKDVRPMYLLIASQGSVENQNLFRFLAQITPELVWFHIVGDNDSDPPWFVICALTLTESLSQAERDDLESRFPIWIENCKEQNQQRLARN